MGTSNVGVQITDGKVTGVNYPNNTYCSDVSDAVQKYSRLTGTSTYGKKSFELSQQTAFLNFVVLAGDGSSVSAVVKNGGTILCTANVNTTTENSKTVAKFVLPVASGTTLSSATVKVGENDALTITNATLTGKVYNVDKAQAAASLITDPAVGQVIGSDGKNYPAGSTLPNGVTAVAMIAYVGSGSNSAHGLAIALEDVSSNTLTLDNSGNNNNSKTAAEWCSAWNTSKAITGGTWRLPSKDDWQNMLEGCGGSELNSNPLTISFAQLNSKLNSAGTMSATLTDDN